LSFMAGRVPVEMLGGTPFPTIGELPYLLTLPPYGFYWFELSAKALPPSWHLTMPEQMPEYITLVLRRKAGYQLMEGSKRVLCAEVLPLYLERQRWFGSNRPAATRISYVAPLPAQADLFLAEVEAGQGDDPESYFMPLAL